MTCAIALLDQLPQNKLAALFGPRRQNWHEHLAGAKTPPKWRGKRPVVALPFKPYPLNQTRRNLLTETILTPFVPSLSVDW